MLFEGLRAGELDAYVEYTGMIAEELFAGRGLSTPAELSAALDELGVRMSAALGFDNTYALGMCRERAAEPGIEHVSDLARHPYPTLGFGEKFLGRADGWPWLRAAHGLPHVRVRGLDHDLAYRDHSAAESAERVEWAARLLLIERLLPRRATQLSGGET